MPESIVLAGGVPKRDDLLYVYTQGAPKALVEMAGKPMIQWVLDALAGAPEVSRIIVVGLGPEHELQSSKPIVYVTDHGSFLGNAVAGIEEVQRLNPQAQRVIVCGCDIPLLQPEMVTYLLELCQDPAIEIYHTLISRQTMEQRFPSSRRSYARFADGHFAAGDIHVLAPHIAHVHRDLWDALLRSRKSVIKQAFHLGPWFLMKYVSGQLSLAELERRVHRRFSLRVRALPVDFPEMGMDADKPFQVEICRQELARVGAG